MTPERWQQIAEWFEAALEREPEARHAFLAEVCNGDEGLCAEVESLLSAHQQAGSFIAEPVLDSPVSPLAQSAEGSVEPPVSDRSLVGQALGHYQILEKLGQGGMGVVYKARDNRLGRWVAIKVLAPESVADPERKRRFVHEARAASSLNHPNIITIHDIASQNGLDFMAMEYVPGKTLDQLIPPKGLGEALNYALQVADALAAAHAAGIIHRDLKPSNIMVNPNGLVKVLDFGLAKLTDKARSDELEDAQTLQTMSQTEEGVVLGTVSYMSPEQAEGKRVDVRSDIFSFGSILYEIVTGQRAFQGDSKLSIMTAILREEPKPPTEIVKGLPQEAEQIIARCLRKGPEQRWQTMVEMTIALSKLKRKLESGALVATAAPQRYRPGLIWAAVGLVILAVASGVVWIKRSTSQVPEGAPTVVPLTSYPGQESEPSFSPDGNQVAFSWNGEKQDNPDIYVKLIGSGSTLRLTSDPAEDYSPAWSPDGRWIAFLRELPGGKAAVLLIPSIGGPERKVAEIASTRYQNLEGPFLTWAPDGNWLVVVDQDPSNGNYGLFLLSLETGEKRRLTFPPEGSRDDGPAFSPDGRALVFIRWVASHTGDLYLLPLVNGLRPAGEPKRLTFDKTYTSSPVWTIDGQDIVFTSFYPPSGVFSLWRMAASGVGRPQRLPELGENGSQPAISRQGHRLAYTRLLGWEDQDIWRVEIPGPRGETNPSTKFISSSRNEFTAQYSPDGKKIAFSSGRSGTLEIWVCDSDGSNAVQLTSLASVSLDPRWLPDGQRLGFDSTAEGQPQIYVVNINGGKPQRLTSDPAAHENPSWSQDGRWIYVDSNRGGPREIWKMPAQGGVALQVTRSGGFVPVESRDGRFLYYAKCPPMGCSLWRVPVEGGEESQILGSLSLWNSYDVVDDGIYFVPRPRVGTGTSIQFLNFATGRTKQIAAVKRFSSGLSISPDRRWILYSQVNDQGSDLMLVENFH